MDKNSKFVINYKTTQVLSISAETIWTWPPHMGGLTGSVLKIHFQSKIIDLSMLKKTQLEIQSSLPKLLWNHLFQNVEIHMKSILTFCQSPLSWGIERKKFESLKHHNLLNRNQPYFELFKFYK